MPRFIDVVEAPDVSGKEIVKREPPHGSGDFRLGSQVIVRESQVAVFFRDGKALDVFGSGRHTITTANIPILASLINLATSGKTPFTAEVVFVNMRQFIDQKWGTPEPVLFRDPDLWGARLRAFGTYSFQVTDPSLFVNGIVGQQGIFTTRDVENYFRSIIIQRFLDLLGEQKVPLLDLASMYNEISAGTRAMLADDFQALGITLQALYVSAITPTEETQKLIEQRMEMGAFGDAQTFMQYQAARAMRDAANNPGGDAGTGAGLGAGMGMGAAMANMMSQAFQPQQPQQAPQQPAPQQSPPAPAAASGPITREQVQQAIDNLDLRFSMGEISEATYNRLMQKWEEKLKELGG
ncbi:MAG: SPFH domain-containing protein [Chloroflexaceae bacterium]|nr:SPFH domain-containing protein [Chloroflexaceae bacterium]